MASYDIGKLIWYILGDTSGIDKSLNNTNKSVDNTGKKFAGLGGIIAKTFTLGAVVMFGKTIAKAGSDAQETAQKFGVVFSTIQEDAQKTAKSLAQDFNFSNNAAMELLAGTGNLLEGLGYTQTEALKMSESIAQLGSDLTSMNNYAGGAAEATRILTKALLGEREALQALDLKVTDDQLRAYAKSLGTTWDALTQAEKARATFNVIMAQSANAIGDVERSQDSAASIWRKLENTFDNITVQLGEELLPGLTYLGQTLLSVAEDSVPLISALGVIVRMASNVVKSFAIMLRVLNSVQLSIRAIYQESKAQEARENLTRFMSVLEFQYKDIVKAENEHDKTSRTLTGTLKHLAEAHGDVTAAYNLKSLKNLLDETANAANVSKEATEKYIDNATAIATAFGNETADIKKAASERTEIRKKEAEEARKQFLKSQELMGSGKGKSDQVKELEDLTQSQIDYGRTLTTRSQLESYINKLNREATDAALKGEDKKEAAIRKSISALQDLSKQMERTWADLSDQEKLEAVNNGFQTIGSGLISVLQAADQLTQQLFKNRMDVLDEQMQAELEAAGVAEETAVQKAQREVNEAGASVTVEQTKALQKAQIEEKYQKKKRQLEYESNLMAWQFQVAQASIQALMAPLNAYTSTAAIPVVGPVLAPIAAALAATAAGLMMAAVIEAKPQPPKFATGGIIPGSTQGTKLIAGENNKTEVIMNQDQMANTLMAIANGNIQGGYRQVPPMSETALWSMIFKASQNGDLFIAENAVVSK